MVLRHRSGAKVTRTPAERWAVRAAMRAGDAAWTYLAGPRAIPPPVLIAAARQDCVRLGAYGSAWFAHRWQGAVTHVEIRSPTFKGSLRGGRKTLFCFGSTDASIRRLTVLEAAIDALSLARLSTYATTHSMSRPAAASAQARSTLCRSCYAGCAIWPEPWSAPPMQIVRGTATRPDMPP